MGSSDGGTVKKIALFTPLPPARTGTADYAAALIPALEKYAAVEIFEKAPRGFDPDRYGATIYQIANNPYHAEIYEAALRYPGIVVLHEANLHDLIRGMTAHQPSRYLNEVVFEMFGLELKAMSGAGIQPGPQPRTFSMARRLLERSRACIVHSDYVGGEVRRKGFRGKICRINHGVKPGSRDGSAYRMGLGISSDQPVIGMFGYLRSDKMAVECLSVFRELLVTMPSCRMIVVGTPHPEVPLEAAIDNLGLRGNVDLIGFQSLDDLDGYIAACDVVLNLRWPTFGETSGIAMRAFGMGRAVVVSDSGSDREWPDDICVRIPRDRYRDEVLLEALKWLLSSPEITKEIGSSAAAWTTTNATWDLVARQYAEFAANWAEPPEAKSADPADDRSVSRLLLNWVEPGTPSERYLLEHMNRLVRTLQLTPSGRRTDRILEMGCYLQITPALRELHRYGEVRGCYLGSGRTDMRAVRSRDGNCFECAIDVFDCECDPFPYPDEHFQTVLCCELIEHLRVDPLRTLCEIHRILKPGGILLLTTPNIVSLRAVNAVLRGNHPGFYSHYPDPDGGGSIDPRHEREYTPAEVSKLLTAAGFVVDRIETAPYGAAELPEAAWAKRALVSLGQSEALRDDCIFALGRKAPLPFEFRPAWLYDSRLYDSPANESGNRR